MEFNKFDKVVMDINEPFECIVININTIEDGVKIYTVVNYDDYKRIENGEKFSPRKYNLYASDLRLSNTD